MLVVCVGLVAFNAWFVCNLLICSCFVTVVGVVGVVGVLGVVGVVGVVGVLVVE